MLLGWISDHPAASSFFMPLLVCRDTLQKTFGNDAVTANVTGTCAPKIDAMVEEALATQQNDPSAARDRWAAVDRAFTDHASLVPMSSIRNAVVVSERAGNVQGHSVYQVLLSQMWVR